MVLRLNQRPFIEDLRKHSPAMIEELWQLLAGGAQAEPDPRRRDFFELESDSRIFYIYISPVNGKVILLGTWPRTKVAVALSTADEAA